MAGPPASSRRSSRPCNLTDHPCRRSAEAIRTRKLAMLPSERLHQDRARPPDGLLAESHLCPAQGQTCPTDRSNTVGVLDHRLVRRRMAARRRISTSTADQAARSTSPPAELYSAAERSLDHARTSSDTAPRCLSYKPHRRGPCLRRTPGRSCWCRGCRPPGP